MLLRDWNGVAIEIPHKVLQCGACDGNGKTLEEFHQLDLDEGTYDIVVVAVKCRDCRGEGGLMWPDLSACTDEEREHLLDVINHHYEHEEMSR